MAYDDLQNEIWVEGLPARSGVADGLPDREEGAEVVMAGVGGTMSTDSCSPPLADVRRR